MKKLAYIFAIFGFSSLFGITAINIVEVGEKDNGVYGSVDLGTNFSKGNSERERYFVSASLQKFKTNGVWLFSGKYTFQQSKYDGTYHKTVNKSYLHTRHILGYSKKVSWEYFGQIESNEFQKLAFRGLFGIGMRFRPFEKKIYFGISPMFVRESYLDTGIASENSVKGNFYVNMVCPISDKLDISYIAYLQPKLDMPKDFELKQTFELENQLTTHFSLIIRFSYDYDANPIDDTVSTYDFEQRTILRYKF
jgi:hypothetical protein